MKNSTLFWLIVIVLIGVGFHQTGITGNSVLIPENQQESTSEEGGSELQSERFLGILQEVNTGCFADGECYVLVDDKKVTLLIGWTNEIVGSIIGSDDGIGGLEKYINEEVQVFAQKIDDNSYSLYGNEEYYIEVKNND